MRVIVQVEVEDLRQEPHTEAPLESQLVQGEEVEIIGGQDEWLFVRATEQPRFSEEAGWHPYPGWIRPESIAFAALPSLPEEQPFDREKLIADGKKFLGRPYLWGGRHEQAVDCSGFVSLLYRKQGIIVPRDAHDQFLWAEPTERPQPGDLVFTAKAENPERKSHVLIFLGPEGYLEAPETGEKVRIRTSLDVPAVSGALSCGFERHALRSPQALSQSL